MCPYRKQCVALITGFMMTEIMFCGLTKEDCPCIRNKQPDIPVEHFYQPPQEKNIIIASGSPTISTIALSQYSSDLSDGRKLYYINPTNMGIDSGKFIIVDNNGKGNIVAFEKTINE